MKHPSSHERAPHAMWADRWNPYLKRETLTHKLDDVTFNALLGRSMHCDIDPNLLLCYCLDAPEEVPAGSTLCIKTVGGYEREEYNRVPREQQDWKRAARASHAAAQMIKEVLAKSE